MSGAVFPLGSTPAAGAAPARRPTLREQGAPGRTRGGARKYDAAVPRGLVWPVRCGAGDAVSLASPDAARHGAMRLVAS